MTVSKTDLSGILTKARIGIDGYLENALKSGEIDQQLYDVARANTYPNLAAWLEDPHIDKISPSLKSAIGAQIRRERWEEIVNAFRQRVRFGTGGIRGMMAFNKESIEALNEKGLDAPILKGPNTINDIVLLLTSAGVAKFGRDRGFEKIVIGYDSRIRGGDFAKIVAELFLGYGYTVYFFDAPCAYPEVTYAIPDELVRADMGILISASHNDYRYNGYKLSCANGSQFDPEERDAMYNSYIAKATTADIILCSFAEAPAEKLWFLGGDGLLEPERFDYAGKQANLINMHARHRDHIKSFLMMKDLAERQRNAANPLVIAFCAFHGAGNVAVPRLLREVGFADPLVITAGGLNDLNGFFPSFCSEPGREQQPDPGDPRAAKIAVDAFHETYPGRFSDVDILLGTDPDADRCGVIVKVPEAQRHVYDGRDWTLLPADDLWALLIWYRLHREREMFGEIRDADKKFIILSHTTSDCLIHLARKYGIGVVKTWVGFASLSAGVREMWDGHYDKYLGLVEGRHSAAEDVCDPIICQCYGMDERRSINIAALEQSNGFSLLGGRPKDRSSLGENGHVRDKDGTFAACLAAEVAAWAGEQHSTVLELIDAYISLDPEIGLFVAGYEPDPLDGEYPGIRGDRLKTAILRRALGYFQLALAGDLTIADLPVKSAVIYRTGKYDSIYPPTYNYRFPDEGVRFFFDQERLSHCTIRPSGTGNSLRFHTQLHAKIDDRLEGAARKEALIEKKAELRAKTREILSDIRRLLKAPR